MKEKFLKLANITCTARYNFELISYMKVSIGRAVKRDIVLRYWFKVSRIACNSLNGLEFVAEKLKTSEN